MKTAITTTRKQKASSSYVPTSSSSRRAMMTLFLLLFGTLSDVFNVLATWPVVATDQHTLEIVGDHLLYCPMSTRITHTRDVLVVRLFDFRTESALLLKKKDQRCYVADIPKNLEGDFGFEVYTIALAQEASTFDIDHLQTREMYDAIPCVELSTFSGGLKLKSKMANISHNSTCKKKNGETGSGKWILINETHENYFKPLAFGMSMRYRENGKHALSKKVGAGKLMWKPHLWEPEKCSYKKRIFREQKVRSCLESLRSPILFIGDSLLQFYRDEISLLSGKSSMQSEKLLRMHKLRGSVQQLVPRLSRVLGEGQIYSAIILNSGAWDLRSTTASEYQASLHLLVRLFRKSVKNGTRVIFRTTSAPKLPENKRECERYPQRLDRIVRLNDIAVSVFHGAGYEIFDVFPSSLSASPHWYDDNLHLGSHGASSGVHAMHVQMLLSMLC